MHVYPIFLNDLSGRKCVILRFGHDAERKVAELLEAGAAVVVVAPAVSPAVEAWAREGRLTWIARDYERGDLAGAFLAIVTVTDHEATKPIWEEAQDEGILISAMDDVPHCTFVAGSIVRRGDLVISISTSGAAPALAVRLRQEFEERFGPEYADFLALMRRLRGPMAERFPDFEERKRRWYALIDAGLPELLAGGREEEALEAIASITGLPNGTLTPPARG